MSVGVIRRGSEMHPPAWPDGGGLRVCGYCDHAMRDNVNAINGLGWRSRCTMQALMRSVDHALCTQGVDANEVAWILGRGPIESILWGTRMPPIDRRGARGVSIPVPHFSTKNDLLLTFGVHY